MDSRNLPDLIKDALRSNPKGMTVGDVARKIGMNSQSTGRHLDVLAASGQIEVRTFGRSKVYYLSQRVPIFTMINLSQDMILMLDRDLNIVNANTQFTEFTGVPKEEILNKSLGDRAFPIRFNPDIASFAQEAMDGKHFRRDASYQRGEETVYFRIKFIPMLYDNGDKGVMIIFEDVTERKRNEAVLSFLAAIVESSNDAIIGKGLDGTVTSWNKSAERIYGYTADEMVGNSVFTIVPPELHGEVSAILDKVKNGERIQHYETERARKDGRRITVSLTVSPIIDSDGNVLGASTIAFEVPERKRPFRGTLAIAAMAAICFVLDLSFRSAFF